MQQEVREENPREPPKEEQKSKPEHSNDNDVKEFEEYENSVNCELLKYDVIKNNNKLICENATLYI
jgi:hypothetical protein